MDIAKYLILGDELETLISRIYLKVAAITHNNLTSNALIKISHEELNHASTLKMGKNYLKEAPDIFHGVDIDEAELQQGLKDCKELYERIHPMSSVLSCLISLLDLEKRFEKIHLGASVIVSDAHLKRLFQALAGGDQNHFKVLQEMISDGTAH